MRNLKNVHVVGVIRKNEEKKPRETGAFCYECLWCSLGQTVNIVRVHCCLDGKVVGDYCLDETAAWGLADAKDPEADGDGKDTDSVCIEYHCRDEGDVASIDLSHRHAGHHTRH